MTALPNIARAVRGAAPRSPAVRSREEVEVGWGRRPAGPGEGGLHAPELSREPHGVCGHLAAWRARVYTSEPDPGVGTRVSLL